MSLHIGNVWQKMRTVTLMMDNSFQLDCQLVVHILFTSTTEAFADNRQNCAVHLEVLMCNLIH